MNRFKKMIIRVYFEYFKKDNIKYAKKLGVKIGKNSKIIPNPYYTFGSEPWLISLGDHVEITNNVHFITHDGALWVLRYMDSRFQNMDKFGKIVVGNNVFIGNDSIIMPGVTIGDNVIIGAKSLINKNVPSNSIYAGVPAKSISSLEEYINKSISHCIPTKNLKSNQKHDYIKQKYPDIL